MYLTEQLLSEVLSLICPNKEFVKDKVVPNSGVRTRPDYRNDDLMLIVEFDGNHHYQVSKKIKNEINKTKLYEEMGYNVVRIPYFIQISSQTIKHLFGVDMDYKQVFPHGFISKRVIMPADFSEMGILKFKEDLKKFNYIKPEIIKSLSEKIKTTQDIDLVIPSSLQYLVD